MPCCAAIGCRNRPIAGKKITFHRFPLRSPELRQKWLVNIRRDDWEPSSWSMLCSEHFEEKCFDRTGQTVRLREGAVPTLFTFPSHLTRSVSKNRRLAVAASAASKTEELCVVPKCTNGRDPSKGVTLHKIPPKDPLRQQWLKATGREDSDPGPQSFVCSVHFTEDSFKNPHGKQPKLVPSAVPSVFNFPEEPDEEEVEDEASTSNSDTPSCVIVDCRNTPVDPNELKVTFHEFPKNPKLCASWVEFVGKRNWTPRKGTFLCSRHFNRVSFVSTRGSRVLKPAAIPTIHMPEQPKVAEATPSKSPGTEDSLSDASARAAHIQSKMISILRKSPSDTTETQSTFSTTGDCPMPPSAKSDGSVAPILQCHSYAALDVTQMKRKIAELEEETSRLQKVVKTEKQKNRRLTDRLEILNLRNRQGAPKPQQLVIAHIRL